MGGDPSLVNSSRWFCGVSFNSESVRMPSTSEGSCNGVAGRVTSRTALCRTDRLAEGCLTWELEAGSPVPDRGWHPMRCLWGTEAGKSELRQSRTPFPVFGKAWMQSLVDQEAF